QPKYMNVEKVELKGLSHKKNDRNIEYSFEVVWSDSSVTSVTKSSAEVTEFISKLNQLYPEENLEKFIPCLTGPDSFYLDRNHMDLESDLRYLASLPPHVWKNDHVKKFFSTSSHSQQFQSSSEPICGVAGIQSSQGSLPQHHAQHPPSATTSVSHPHCAHAGGSGASLACRAQLENPSPVLMVPGPQAPQQAQEQNGILDWLRKLRLHKYYPVFKQLSMDKFLSLTEEDLNKFESLTMGAKKKLKTQLELEKEKSEKRTLNPAASSSVSTGVARVPPTTHIGPIQSIRGNHATELCVDVDPPAPSAVREGSSSEYSSSSSSPMGIQAREESSDSAEESERRLEPSEKEKPVMILNHFGSGSSRPTAQVLPVQNDAGSSPSAHHNAVPVPLMAAASPHITPIRILNSMHKPERGNADMKLLSSSMHSLLSLDDRAKFSPGPPPPRSSVKMEKGFGNPLVDGHQPLQVFSGVPENGSMSFVPRTKMVHASALDRVAKAAQQPGMIGEANTSSATVTSTAVFHMARPPIKLLVSSSVPTDSAAAGGQSSCSGNMQFSVSPAIISPRTALYTANTKVAFSAMSSMPVAPMPSSSFCANSNTAASGSHPSTSFANMTNPVPSSSPVRVQLFRRNSFYSNSGGEPPTPPPPPPAAAPGCMVCSSCGCSGNCGSGGMTVSYANYFQHPFSGPSMFTFPFLPFNPLCGNGYINTQQYNSSSAFPMVHSPYNGGLAPDSVMGGQSAFAVPPMQNFMAGAAGVYQAQGAMGGGGGGSGAGHKKNGNLSCYNCGASGHRAQDCKQPPMDFNRQGFVWKHAPRTEHQSMQDW
uniref:CCHC-type domain-containing protein n=1 Tax=Anolis carolinensis TaxID=28377 RepID=A0A803TPB5_ANOCA